MMLFPRAFTFSVLLILGWAIALVTARPIPNTNAARLARGLPPAPPRFGRNLPGVATPVKRNNPSPSASASPSPILSYSGLIQVRTLNGTVLGNVRNSNSGDIGGVNFQGSKFDLEVQLNAQGTGPYDIQATDALFQGSPFIGAGGQSTLGNGLNSKATLSPVVQTPQGSPPVVKNGQAGQSAIWNIDKQTKKLTAVYVNPDATKPPTVTLAYDIKSNTLFFTGDLTAWNTNNDEPASEVNFFIVPA